MTNPHIRDVSQALIVSITEEELANRLVQQGKVVICHQGFYWEQTIPGFYQPIHLMSGLSVKSATRPTPFCWGFRAALCKDDTAIANGAIPIHLLSNVEDYDLQSLSSNRRSHLRKCSRMVKIVELTDSQILHEQGYEVFASAVKRTGYGKIKNYLAQIANIDFGYCLVIAGLIDGKLGGYLVGYAINEIAYIHEVNISTEALSTCISTGLHFEFVQACRRSDKIRAVVHGLHAKEDEALCVFKAGMGFPVNSIPAKVQINPIIGKFIRWRYPYKYYRLTGWDCPNLS